jgi:hypothetical protein
VAQRGKAVTAQLKVRLPEELRERIEKEAGRAGIPLNRAIVGLIENAFRLHDIFGAGQADVLDFYLLLGSTFSYAGKEAAQQNGHPEWTADEWRGDPDCYEKAALAVTDVIWKLHPDRTGRLGMFRFWLSRLYGRVAALYKETEAVDDLPAVGPSMLDLRDPAPDPLEDTGGWIGGIVR